MKATTMKINNVKISLFLNLSYLLEVKPILSKSNAFIDLNMSWCFSGSYFNEHIFITNNNGNV